MSDFDGFEVMPHIDERTNRGKIASRDKRIQQLEGDQETRWFELFGTPERVVETLDVIADGLYSHAWSDEQAALHDMLCLMADRCVNCPLYGGSGGVTTRCRRADESDLLEWLRGKAVKQ